MLRGRRGGGSSHTCTCGKLPQPLVWRYRGLWRRLDPGGSRTPQLDNQLGGRTAGWQREPARPSEGAPPAPGRSVDTPSSQPRPRILCARYRRGQVRAPLPLVHALTGSASANGRSSGSPRGFPFVYRRFDTLTSLPHAHTAVRLTQLIGEATHKPPARTHRRPRLTHSR